MTTYVVGGIPGGATNCARPNGVIPVVSHEKAKPGIPAIAAMTANVMKLWPMTAKVLERTLPMSKDRAVADSVAMISPCEVRAKNRARQDDGIQCRGG
jgi:hypothetical protein